MILNQIAVHIAVACWPSCMCLKLALNRLKKLDAVSEGVSDIATDKTGHGAVFIPSNVFFYQNYRESV